MCIEHVFIYASVRVLKHDSKHYLLKEFNEYINLKFPNYKKLKYEQQLSAKRKLIYKLLEYKQYKLISFIFKVKDLI